CSRILRALYRAPFPGYSCCVTFCSLIRLSAMRRVYASLALLFVLGTFAAPAWGTLAAPSHACCLRKAHHCGAPQSTVKAIHNDSPCCQQCSTTAAQSPAALPRPLRLGAAHDPHPFLTEFLPAFDAQRPAVPADGRAPPAPGQ